MDPNRLLEHVHGHVGWLAVASLVHPAVVLRSPARKAPWAVGASTALVTLAGAMGATLYVPYRDTLKQAMFVHAPAMGLLFERKEHLAFGAVMLAWAGAVAYFAASRESGSLRASLRAIAFRAYVLASLLAAIAAALGTWVAAYKTF